MAREKTTSNLPVTVTTLGRATRAKNGGELGEEASRGHLEVPATMGWRPVGKSGLEQLVVGLRAATVEDVRDALGRITQGVAETTGRQYVLRVKSLLGYAHRLGYAHFNAGATIRVRSDAGTAAPLWRSALSPRSTSLCWFAALEPSATGCANRS